MAVKLGCVLALAVAPLLNIWHTPGSGQNLCWPASFDWSNILRLAHRLPPLLAPTITPSPSNLHGGFKWSMGGLARTYHRGIEKACWVFECGGLRPGVITSGWPGMAWWTWFRWYSPCIHSWGAICRGSHWVKFEVQRRASLGLVFVLCLLLGPWRKDGGCMCL